MSPPDERAPNARTDQSTDLNSASVASVPASAPSALTSTSTSNSKTTEQSERERFSAFSTFYVGLFALLFAYLISVLVAEALLHADFRSRAEAAIADLSIDAPLGDQIRQRIDAAIHESRWVRPGGLDVKTLVVAQDASTWLYVDGFGTERFTPQELIDYSEANARRPAPGIKDDTATDWMNLLPARAIVSTTLPHNSLISNSILIAYSTLLLLISYLTHRRVSRNEGSRLKEAFESRELAAQTASEIEGQLHEARLRLFYLDYNYKL